MGFEELVRFPGGACAIGQRAENNIDELVEDLNRTFHRACQGGIDEDLFGVITPFEALQSDKRPPNV